ncbi:MAG: glycosyltransferase family 4 protein [Eubacteriales bacterium]|nr:glycosyltransferase family 4 protein [Eubacteriales bacterium]
MGKKRVLFAATVVKTHIMQFHIPYLRMFQDMGWETAVAARNDYENPADCVIPACDTYYDIPFERVPWKKGNLRAYKMLKKVIDEGNFDIIHCHTPVGAMLTRLAARQARKRGTKVLYTAHGFHFYKGAPLLNWLAFYPVEWLLAPLTDVLLTMNREDYTRAKKHIHAKRVEYVPGVGISREKFSQSVDRPAKRRELGFGDGDFLMLTVAELIGRKNHITVLRAMGLLKNAPEFENLHYLIVGRGEARDRLESAAHELGIESHVHFLGYRTDVAALYKACDLFAFVPFQEGLPVALMEAMCCGLPVFCTDIRGNADLIDDGVSGLFTDNNPRAVADTILKLYRDPALRSRCAAAAAEKVLNFTDETVHERMREIYLSV